MSKKKFSFLAMMNTLFAQICCSVFWRHSHIVLLQCLEESNFFYQTTEVQLWAACNWVFRAHNWSNGVPGDPDKIEQMLRLTRWNSYEVNFLRFTGIIIVLFAVMLLTQPLHRQVKDRYLFSGITRMLNFDRFIMNATTGARV